MFSSMAIEEYMKSEIFLFLSKTGCQKYSVLSQGTQRRAAFPVSLYEEIYKFSEPECYTMVFSLLINILILFE